MTCSWQDGLGFFINGLVNNFTYVLFLSAAVDLVHQSNHGISEGAVLLADILPGLAMKLVAPYFMHRLTYGFRIVICVLAAIVAMQVVAWNTHSLPIQFLGIILASAGSGLGEITYLALSSWYHCSVIGWWGSGTGAAGLVGALTYLMLTSWLKMSLTVTLCLTSALPLLNLFSYFILMSKPHLRGEQELIESVIQNDNNQTSAESVKAAAETDQLSLLPTVSSSYGSTSKTSTNSKTYRLGRIKKHSTSSDSDDDHDPVITGSSASETIMAIHPVESTADSSDSDDDKIPPALLSIREKMKLVVPLIRPYMVPLFIVYWAEYTINQGIAPVILFPVEKTPFSQLRDLGVFISRSSVSWFPIKRILIPSLLQVLTLILLLCQAMFDVVLPSVYLVLLVILWEGLLGGATYVNAFYNISVDVHPTYREFSMGVVALADTLGITVAGISALFIGPALCQWKIAHGNDLCRNIKAN